MTWEITVRPWNASGGSTVHDELSLVIAETAREALISFYDNAKYDFAIWRIIDLKAEYTPALGDLAEDARGRSVVWDGNYWLPV